MRNSRIKQEQIKIANGFAVALLIIIIAVMVIAALIVIGSNSVRNIKLPEYEFGRVTQDAQIRDLNNLSSSDELGAIEKDINSTNLEGIDQETNDINREALDL